jgi:DNA-binding response OmpR family regulator
MGELVGRKVLVVEDNALIAWELEATLQEAGCVVVGPCGTLAEAFGACETDLDAALLDLNVGGEFTMSLANRLSSAGVPIVFVTGYGDDMLATYRETPIITKPYRRSEVLVALSSVMVCAPA